MAEQTITRTLFVRNLPYTCTNEKIEALFSDIGPVKRCFVVKDKDVDDSCKGYGYVTFSELEDAKTAKEKIKVFEGRSLQLIYSRPKDSKKKKKQRKNEAASEFKLDSSDDEPTPTEKITEKKLVENTKRQSVAKQKYTAACTVLLSDLPDNTTEKDVSKLTKNTKGVESINLETPSRAVVKYSSKAEAVEAAKKLGSIKHKGKALKVLRQSQEMILTSQKYLQRCKLIVRNLSFQCSEEDFKAAFNKFGKILQVSIPEDAKGKKKGFGFLQFSRLEDAAAALKEMNTKPIKGRTVAIDWSIPKTKFQKTSQEELPAAKNEEDADKLSDEGSFSAESDINMDVDNDKNEAPGDEDSGEDEKEEEEESEDESDDEDDDEENDESDEQMSDDEESDLQEDGSEDDLSSDEGFSEKEKKPIKEPRKEQKDDVGEGKTLFIRNLCFETEEEDLGEKFEEFGKLVYARIVVDPTTERSRGTAFVQFKSKEDVDKCLEAASEESQEGIMLDGRRLNVIMAVARKKAAELKQSSKEKEIKDKRNLWLVREGMIRSGTQAAQGLSEADLAKRERVEKLKRQKLKNPNIFVSTTRLCVRNLPVTVNDKKLKQVFLKSVGQKSAVITESRVMRDLKRVNSQGLGKSMGFGFVNFKEHEHALSALRATNNNPDLFGEKKRLIVEFSLENKAALLAKEKRLERNQTKKQMFKKDTPAKKPSVNEEATNKKQYQKKVKPTDIVKPIPVKTEEESEERKKIPKGLPKHWGPKVRHKARDVPNKKQKPNKGEWNQSRSMKRKADNWNQSRAQMPDTKKAKRNRGKKEQTDDFDRLVNKYTQRLSTAVKAQTKMKGSKWFD